MWRFIPFYWRGSSKLAVLLEGKWGCIFLFAWCQCLKMWCQDPVVPATAQMEQKAAPTDKQTARQEARAMPIPWRQAAVACWVECQAHLQPCHFCAQGGVWGQSRMRTNEVALQVFTGSFFRGMRSMGENLNPQATHPPVSSAGSLPQAGCSSLLPCAAQPQGRVMWVKQRVLCLNLQFLSLCGGFKPLLLAFMLSILEFFYSNMFSACLSSLPSSADTYV